MYNGGDFLNRVSYDYPYEWGYFAGIVPSALNVTFRMWPLNL